MTDFLRPAADVSVMPSTSSPPSSPTKRKKARRSGSSDYDPDAFSKLCGPHVGAVSLSALHAPVAIDGGEDTRQKRRHKRPHFKMLQPSDVFDDEDELDANTPLREQMLQEQRAYSVAATLAVLEEKEKMRFAQTAAAPREPTVIVERRQAHDDNNNDYDGLPVVHGPPKFELREPCLVDDDERQLVTMPELLFSLSRIRREFERDEPRAAAAPRERTPSRELVAAEKLVDLTMLDVKIGKSSATERRAFYNNIVVPPELARLTKNDVWRALATNGVLPVAHTVCVYANCKRPTACKCMCRTHWKQLSRIKKKMLDA